MGKSNTSKRKAKAHDKRLESQLTTLERQVLKALDRHLSATRTVSGHVPTEFMDIASDSEVDDLEARIAEADSDRINEIEEALRLLRAGEYGICQGCGSRIAARRLKARPFAVLCINCKQLQERGQAVDIRPFPVEGADVSVDLGGRDLEDDAASYHDVFRDIETGELL